MFIQPRNLFLAVQDQLPLDRALHNFFVTGIAWGLFSPNSHLLLSSGLPKVAYSSKGKALKAAGKMQAKHGGRFSAYKCAFCDFYHVGRSRTRKEAKNRINSV